MRQGRDVLRHRVVVREKLTQERSGRGHLCLKTKGSQHKRRLQPKLDHLLGSPALNFVEEGSQQINGIDRGTTAPAGSPLGAVECPLCPRRQGVVHHLIELHPRTALGSLT